MSTDCGGSKFNNILSPLTQILNSSLNVSAAISKSLVGIVNGNGSYSATFTIANKCNYAIWLGILSAARTSLLSITGFALQTGDSNTILMGPAWSGSIWGRTLCFRDITTKFSCVTGDCSSSTVECFGGNTAPPVTLEDFTLNSTSGLDFFDVSLVDGFNLPVKINGLLELIWASFAILFKNRIKPNTRGELKLRNKQQQ
ncbi:Thaumatin protein 1 [Spatholobus suberectus]|nr:Thaumatin protein 1 [Spatholobus suberectus]